MPRYSPIGDDGRVQDWLSPQEWDAYPLPDFTDEDLISLPEEGEFCFTILTNHRRWHTIQRVLKQYWAGNFYDSEHLIDWMRGRLYYGKPEMLQCEPATIPDDDCPTCKDYAPSARFIEWNPQDPFRSPENVPDGYDDPPWKTVTNSPIPGTQEGDVYTTIFELPNPLEILGFIDSGFPRFKVRFSGSGRVQLYLLSVPQGGLALITLDGQPDSGEIVDLSSLDIGEFDDYFAFLETLTDQAIEGGLLPVQIVEINVEDDGDHYIDVTMLPKVGFDSGFGWGGGLRKVTFCGFSELVQCEDCPEPEPAQAPRIRQNLACTGFEWLNPDTNVWEPIQIEINPNCSPTSADDDSCFDECCCDDCCNCECEDEMCCKCGNGAPTGTVPLYLNPTTGQLYYKDSSGNPVPYVPPVNAGDVPPAPSEDETPSGEYQCYKATAIAKMIERALGDMSTAISQGEVTDHVDLANDFKSVVGTDYQVNTVKALAFAKAVMPNTTTQVVVGLDYSNADALIKALACMIQYRISNEVRLSDADISAARAALSAPVAGTSMVVLQAAFDVLVPSELKNNAYLESQRGTAVCDCEGDQPAPPAPPVEPDPAKDPIPVESACNRATYVKSVKIDFEDYQPGLPVATVKNYPVAGARAGAGFSLSNIGVNQYDSPVYNASVLLHFEKNVKFLGCRMYYSHGSASSISPRFDITVQGWTDPLSNGLSLGSQFGAVPAPQQGLTTMVSSNASADISDLLLILIATCNPDTTLASPKATSLLITVQYLGINYTITVGEQFGCEEAGGVA